MALHLRLSDAALCFASYDYAHPADVQFAKFDVNPQVSQAANLHEALQSVNFAAERTGRTEVHVNQPVSIVPLAEFQEEDAEAFYDFSFKHEEKRQVFYDMIPVANAVALFAVPQALCQTLEDALGEVRYSANVSAVVQHFSSKTQQGLAPSRRLYLYIHEGSADMVLFEESRLIALNSFAVRAVNDVIYYASNLVKHVGMPFSEVALYIAGEPALCQPVLDGFKDYTPHVFSLRVASEFNRHPVSTLEDIPYDLVCALLK